MNGEEMDIDISRGDALGIAEDCLKEPTQRLCQGTEPNHFWLVGGSIKDVRPSQVTKHISLEEATLKSLVDEVRRQLKSLYDSIKARGSNETVYIIFAVGIFDLVPDATPVSLIKHLNDLVALQRDLRQRLSSYDDIVCNVCFASTYPPSMERLGSAAFSQHAQQFVNIAFRWYNRWTLIVNNMNGSGICRLDKPFQCVNGKYKLKVGQLADDGIMPNSNMAKLLASSVDKCVARVKDMWAKNESFRSERADVALLRNGWQVVKEAEKVYLDAFIGADASFHEVLMPFLNTSRDREITSQKGVVASLDSNCAEQTQAHRTLVGHTTAGKAAGRETTADGVVETVTQAGVSKTGADDKESSPQVKSREALDISMVTDDDLHLYQVAKGIVSLCPVHIQSKALRLLQTFKEREKKRLQMRLNEDRDRVACFQGRVKSLKKNPRMYSVKQREEHCTNYQASSSVCDQNTSTLANQRRHNPRLSRHQLLPSASKDKKLNFVQRGDGYNSNTPLFSAKVAQVGSNMHESSQHPPSSRPPMQENNAINAVYYQPCIVAKQTRVTPRHSPATQHPNYGQSVVPHATPQIIPTAYTPTSYQQPSLSAASQLNCGSTTPSQPSNAYYVTQQNYSSYLQQPSSLSAYHYSLQPATMSTHQQGPASQHHSVTTASQQASNIQPTYVISDPNAAYWQQVQAYYYSSKSAAAQPPLPSEPPPN